MSLSKKQFAGLTVFLVIFVTMMMLIVPRQEKVVVKTVVEKVIVKDCSPSSSATEETAQKHKAAGEGEATRKTEDSNDIEEEGNSASPRRRRKEELSLPNVAVPRERSGGHHWKPSPKSGGEMEEVANGETTAVPTRKDFVPKDLVSYPPPPTIEEASNSTVARWVLQSQDVESLQTFRDFWKIEGRNHAENSLPRINSIIIEVGTNSKPDYCPAMKWNEQTALLGIEPMPIFRTNAYRNCCMKKIGEKTGRCNLYGFGLGSENKWMKLQVAGGGGTCSSFLALKTKDQAQKAECNVLENTVDALVITLDTLFELVLPPHLPISVLSLDMQGYDIYGVSGLKNPEYRARVGNLVLECQDVTEDSPLLIYPGGGTCMQAKMCIEEHWSSDWKFVGCWRNMGPREYNCVWANTAHPFGTKLTRPAWNPIKKKLTGATGPPHFPTEEAVSGCPEYFLTSHSVSLGTADGNDARDRRNGDDAGTAEQLRL